MEQLQVDLEAYLSNGALPCTLGGVERRIQAAVDLVIDALVERRRILLAPQLLDSVRTDQRSRLETSRRVIADLIRDINAEACNLREELVSIMSEPYRQATTTIEGATKIDHVKQAEHRLRLMIETAASRASVKFSQSQAISEQEARRKLFDSFGVTDRLSTSGRSELEWSRLGSSGLVGDIGNRTDWETVGTAAAGTAVAAGLLGGAGAGGVGIALLAAGPIGWLIGMAAGVVLGALGGGAIATALARGKLSVQDRSNVLAALARQRVDAEKLASDLTRRWAEEFERAITAEQHRFFGDQEEELRRIETILRDESGRLAALGEVATLLERVKASR